MIKKKRLGAFGLAVLVVAGLTLLSWVLRTVRGPADAAERDAVELELERLRLAVDSCTSALTMDQAALEAFAERLDSMRTAVRAFESAERTVPAEEYADYLRIFDDYGEAVADWDERTEELQANWQACRELAKTHNAIADSVNAARFAPDTTRTH